MIRKYFLLVSILLLLTLLGTAAICNQCGITPTTEITTTAEANVTSAGENSTTETVSDTTQAQETTEQTTAGEDGTATKPTVNIDRIYGPVKEGNLCIQRFKANIAGSPKPTIKWNHDDSNSAFGKDVAQVNLKSGEEFELKVTVSNSAGSASATVHVKYELPTQPTETTQTVSFTFDPKSGPGGTDVKLNLSEPITFSATVYYNSQELPKSVSADSKTFTVTIPVGAGSDYFKIFYDGKSIQAAEQFTVPIAYNKSMPVVGGTVASNGQVEGPSVYVGDTNTNLFCLGFVSFNITELKGGIISHAVLSFDNRQVAGDPSFFGPLYANSLYWGTKQINLSDISSQGTIIPSIFEGGGTPSNSQDNSLNYSVEPFLQNAINAGQESFQVRIQFTGNITDNDSVDDGWLFYTENISLVVSTVN